MPEQFTNTFRKRGDTELLETIARLYAAGATLAEIAREVGRSDEVVRRLMIAADIPRRPRGQPAGKYLPAGGRIADPDGYILLKANDHPQANSGGYVRKHRLVMERHLGRYLLPEEVVHHINSVKDDNRLVNLQLYASNAEHKRLDMQGNSWAKGDFGNPKRSVRNQWTSETILQSLRALAVTLDRPIMRVDLVPPMPSYRTVARFFGSWREGVALALEEPRRTAEDAA